MIVHYEKQPGKWPWLITKDYTFQLLNPAHGKFNLYHRDTLCAIVDYNYCTIKAGYASDGATRAFTFESMLPGILPHDLFCQFIHNCIFRAHVGSRADGDDLFAHYLRKYTKWPERILVQPYITAVRLYTRTRNHKIDPDLVVEKFA